MPQPKITRPGFPSGYGAFSGGFLTWEFVTERLEESLNYWIATVRPNGRPHCIPIWGVFVDNKLYYDGSPETRHARNIASQPYVSVHLEDGYKVVIFEGLARTVRPVPELAARLSAVYCAKYKHEDYCPQPDAWDEGGLYEVSVETAIAWTSFGKDPTRFDFR